VALRYVLKEGNGRSGTVFVTAIMERKSTAIRKSRRGACAGGLFHASAARRSALPKGKLNDKALCRGWRGTEKDWSINCENHKREGGLK